jgi:peptide chain release factor subunit 1
MMKITLAIPKNKEFKQRLLNEIGLAENIQDKKNREMVVAGLKKITLNYQTGKVFLYDGLTEELVCYDYPLKDFIYHCGADFVVPATKLNELKKGYMLISMDANNATIGILRGKSIQVVYDKDSYVPRKQDCGGQSKARFQRDREEQLKHWLDKIAHKIAEIAEGNNGKVRSER